jgi:nucleoside-diphosphate-sugar epimerase
MRSLCVNGSVKSVLVTGANGFVGHGLCAALSSKGIRVVAGVRRPLNPPLQGAVQAETLELSVDPVRWQTALQSVECVVHLAGWAHKRGPADIGSFNAVNVDGSRFVAEQAAAAGVRRMVFVSSIKVNGEHTDAVAYRASDAPMPEDAYGKSKLAAECAVREVCNASALELAIVRPPLVYGAGVKGNFLRLMKLVKLGLPLPFGSFDNKRSMVGIDNLLSFLEVCLVHPSACGGTWLISDGDDLSTPELVRRIAKSMHRKATLVRIPPRWLQLLAAAMGKRGEFERLAGSLQVDSEPARIELGWKPQCSIDDQIAKAVAAFEHNQT